MAMVVCQECGKSVKKDKLPVHIFNTHVADKDKPFQCRYCSKGKSLTKLISLKLTIITGHGVTDPQCKF